MRVPGRITVFGEAFGGLMEKATASVPTQQAVTTGTDLASWAGTDRYDPELDGVASRLKDGGYIRQPAGPIRSDLPIGYGLASSTALALAHLDRWTGAGVAEAVSYSDRQANGFHPSGADFAAVCANESGVFGLKQWTPLRIALPLGTHLLIVAQERQRTKLEPTLAMRAAGTTLEPLIKALVGTIEASGELDLDALLRYARTLLNLDVYSRFQAPIVASCLARGIIAKGTGSQYDRALLILAPPGLWEGSPPGEVVPKD